MTIRRQKRDGTCIVFPGQIVALLLKAQRSQVVVGIGVAWVLLDDLPIELHRLARIPRAVIRSEMVPLGLSEEAFHIPDGVVGRLGQRAPDAEQHDQHSGAGSTHGLPSGSRILRTLDDHEGCVITSGDSIIPGQAVGKGIQIRVPREVVHQGPRVVPGMFKKPIR